jgi:5-methylcytosine-specific restriction endonuclease McrA
MMIVDESNLRRRAAAANRRAAKFGVPGKIAAEDIADALAEADGKCGNQGCGRPFGSPHFGRFRDQWVVSFRVPLSHGGPCCRENIQIICRKCEIQRTHNLGVLWE